MLGGARARELDWKSIQRRAGLPADQHRVGDEGSAGTDMRTRDLDVLLRSSCQARRMAAQYWLCRPLVVHGPRDAKPSAMQHGIVQASRRRPHAMRSLVARLGPVQGADQAAEGALPLAPWLDIWHLPLPAWSCTKYKWLQREVEHLSIDSPVQHILSCSHIARLIAHLVRGT
jgi:hypothetical protein